MDRGGHWIWAMVVKWMSWREMFLPPHPTPHQGFTGGRQRLRGILRPEEGGRR